MTLGVVRPIANAFYGEGADEIDLDQSKPSASIVYVTPEIAERWLARNHRNRPLKSRNVSKFARDMATGRWQITGEAIKFDTDGNLLDGQNRLTAVVASGATVAMFVVRGLLASAQEVMDSGIPRSTADSLLLRGVSNSKDVTPVAVALMGWETGFFRHCMVNSTPAYTKSEVFDFIEAHPDLPDVVAWVKRVQRELPLPIAALGACAYRFSRGGDADHAADFYERIRELRTAGKGDPIQTLLKRVSDDRLAKRRIWVSTAIYYQVRAWNAFRAFERIEKFQIGSDKSGWATIPVPR